MAVYDVMKNGNAPSGLRVNDVVNTAGGLYQIVRPGTPGAYYNPATGYSSINLNGSLQNALIAYNQSNADYNTAKSQEFAREQMMYQSQSNAKAMEFSAQQAEINRKWQEYMSNTAHQREVADLIAAGLNPVLSAKYGGSSTPSGSTASGVASSGASGSVDSSVNQLVGGLLQALITQSTALQTTSMNNANALQTMNMANLAAIKQSQISAGAVIQSALTNAESAWYVADWKGHWESYLRRTYPSTYAGMISAGMHNLSEAIKNFFDTDWAGSPNAPFSITPRGPLYWQQAREVDEKIKAEEKSKTIKKAKSKTRSD